VNRKKLNPFFIIVIYYVQVVLAVFLNSKFWRNNSHSLIEALPILINLDFLLYLFYHVLYLYIKFSKRIFSNKNLKNPLEFFFEIFSEFKNVKKNYLIITVIEALLIFLIIKKAA
jgi:hypothetical protein